jgi:hypothetical protein
VASDRPVDVLAAREGEAAQLFSANQTARERASNTLLIALLVAAAAAVTSLATSKAIVFIPIPPMVLVILSAAFQQFADVTVLGMARLRLEELINRELESSCFVYESVVADIRKRPPLVVGVRLLQGAYGLGALATLAAGTIIAFDGRPAWVEISYAFATALAGASAALSYRDMLRSTAVATTRLAKELP